MKRAYNFSAGPAALPTDVLEEAQAELLNWHNMGVSVMEISHRAKDYIEIADEARQLMRELLEIPSNYHVLFLPGGGRGQFAAVPLNLLHKKNKAAYVESGHWSRLALEEALRYCEVDVVASGQATEFCSFPDPKTWRVDDASHAYVHYTDNETILGLELHETPELFDTPLVSDMSSNILSKPLKISSYGLIYACAQKNFGPAGITAVIVRDDLVGNALPITPSIFDYQLQIDQDSMLNTPPTLPWYLSGLTLKWIKAQGGVGEMYSRSQRRSKKLYDMIDASGFYHNAIDAAYRSRMNVTFFTENEALDERFIKEAAEAGLLYLKGHKLAGGMRASLYNAMPEEGVDALVDFMGEFERKNG